MALDRLHIEVRLEELFCHDQSPFALFEGDSEPYLWPLVFFIDGPGVRITDPPEFLLTGDVTVLSTHGGHGNLDDDGNVSDGELVPVPLSVGHFIHTSEAMPLPTPCDPLKPEGVLGVMGVVCVLNEEGNVPDDAVVVGYEALTNGLRLELNAFINGRSIFEGEPTQAELDAMEAELSATVENAIRDQLNLLEVLIAAPNPDHPIGTAVFVFALDELLENGETILNARLRLEDPAHDWELRGRILVSEPCPFRVLNRRLVAAGEKDLDLDDFRRSHERLVADGRFNALAWPELVGKHGPTIARALLASGETRNLAREAAAGVLRALSDPDRPVPDELLGDIDRLLDAGIRVGSRQARRDFGELKNVARQLRGKTAAQIVEALDRLPPRGVAVRVGVPSRT